MTRLSKYWQRHITLYGNIFYHNRVDQSREIVASVLWRLLFSKICRERVKAFIKNGEELVRLSRRTAYLSRMRLATVTSSFDAEVRYLAWFSEKKLKSFKSQTSKAFKYHHGISMKLKGLNEEREALQD